MILGIMNKHTLKYVLMIMLFICAYILLINQIATNGSHF